MARYLISFFNELANDSGHMFHCRQDTIEINRARSKERAVEAAKLRFARAQEAEDWRLRATALEVQELPDDADLRTVDAK